MALAELLEVASEKVSAMALETLLVLELVQPLECLRAEERQQVG